MTRPVSQQANLAHASALAVVLVSPKTAGNVGAAARAMLNMGASDLRLVAPRCDTLSKEARAFAVHAEELLECAPVYATLAEALADRDLSVGTTARERSDMPRPQFPAALRPRVQAAVAPAIVFGPEDTGLHGSDLEQCQATLRLPTSDYASLNLAQAVLLVTYEFLQAGAGGAVQGRAEPLPHEHQPTHEPQPPLEQKLATRAEMEGLYGHLEDVMHLTGYTDAMRARHTLRLWRLMLDRAQMSSAESRLFRGLMRQVQWKVRQGEAASFAHKKELGTSESTAG